MKKLDIFLYIFVISMICLAVTFLIMIKSEGGKCVADPLKFTLEQIGDNAYCTCTAIQQNGNTIVYQYPPKNDNFTFYP